MSDREARRPRPKTTTYGIVARDAPTVIVFRRGPTRHVELLRWDLRDDTVIAGQWISAGIETGACGVSPNGELLVYDARKGATTFTAVSRPPYFTALAYLPYSSPWTGGGFFPDDRSLVLGHRYATTELQGKFPPGFAVTDVWTHFFPAAKAAARISAVAAASPDANHGWSMADRGPARKANPRRPSLALERSRSGRHHRTYTLVSDAPARRELDAVDWADWTHDGALIFGRGGCLYRRVLPRSLADTSDAVDVCVVDTSDHRFEEVAPPPEAVAWPGGPRKRRR